MKKDLKPVNELVIFERISKYYFYNYDEVISKDSYKATDYYQGYISFFDELDLRHENKTSQSYLKDGELHYKISKAFTDGCRRALSDVFEQIGMGKEVDVVMISRSALQKLMDDRWLNRCA